MKQIRFSVKQTKFLFKYFWWVPFVYGVGVVLLTIYIFEIFGLYDKVSFPLYECPGFTLCFLDHLPIISQVTFVFKDPLLFLAWFILFLIILFPPMYIFLGMLTFEGKNKSK